MVCSKVKGLALVKRSEALAGLALTYLILTAGVVWEFGSYGLIGSGALGVIALTFMKTEE